MQGAEIPSPPAGFVFLDPSWPCPVPVALPSSAVGADSDRGHCQRSQLSPPDSQFYPYLSSMDTLPWCQLKMKLEQPIFPQLLPRAGLPWDEVLALSLDILKTSSLVPAITSSLVQAVHVQVSFPSLFWYSCMSCSGVSPPCSGSELAAMAGRTGGALLQPQSALGF